MIMQQLQMQYTAWYTKNAPNGYLKQVKYTCRILKTAFRPRRASEVRCNLTSARSKRIFVWTLARILKITLGAAFIISSLLPARFEYPLICNTISRRSWYNGAFR